MYRKLAIALVHYTQWTRSWK